MRFLAILLLLFIPAVDAQTTGDLHGLVKDASEKAIAGAKVTAKSENSTAVRSVETDGDGKFVFTALPVGQYTVEIEADGYKSYVQHYLDVTLGHVLDVPVLLESGESTKVLALETPLVERVSSQIGAAVASNVIVGLPLNTRDTYQLLQLQPGVQSQQGYDMFVGSENSGVVSVNGGRGRANNFNVNGGDANDLYAGIPTIQPSPDSIEEFRVLTNMFDAEYGRNSGSIVNVVTKSGSNDFHGSAYEFFRNRSLNTRGFFDTEKPKFNQNQFGGTFGGALHKDKTFFFVSAERRAIRQGISSDLVIVPTAAERLGDFSGSAPFAGTLNDEYLAGVLNQRPGCAAAVQAAGGSRIAANTPWVAIFPGNRMPAACFDRTAVDLMNQFVPLPNFGANTLQTVPVQSENSVQPTVRIDHAVSATNQLTFYHYFNDGSVMQPFSRLQGLGANVPGFGSQYKTRNQQFNLADTWSVNATTINEARFTFSREGQLSYNHPQNTNVVQKSCVSVAAANCFTDPQNPRLGILPGLGASREGVPFVEISGGFSFGNSAHGELPQVGNTFHWSDNLSKMMGNHRAKAGIDVRRQRFDQTFYYDVNGNFNFLNGGSNDVGATSAIPNYLLGLPSSYSQGSAQTENIRNTTLALFAQDSWSVSKRLTLNYGLRWELNTPMADAGRRIQTFRPGQATTTFPCKLDPSNPLVATFGTTECGPGSAGESVFPLGLVVPGDAGVPNGLTATYYHSFAPRIAFAWSPAARSGLAKKLFGGEGRTSIRAGWGLFYNPIEQIVMEQFSAEPPFGGSSVLSNTLFNTPFQAQDGAVNANPFNGFLNPKPGQAIDWSVFRPNLLYGQFPESLRSQYSASYNFTIQRQIRGDTLLQVGYVGSQGHRLLATRDLNYGQAQTCLDLNSLSQLTDNPSLACGPFSSDSAFTVPAGTIPQGFTLHLPYGPTRSVTGPNANPITLVGLRPYSSPSCNPLTGKGCPPDGVPVFASIFSEDTIANSNYHSLQVSVEKRTVHGLQFQAAYTFSKSIDNASSFEEMLNPLDYRSTRSLSLFDARHRMVLSYHWDLPKTPVRGLFGKVVNDWAVSGILTLQSGVPIPITSFDDLELMSSSDFSSVGRPDMVAPLRRLNPRNSDNLAFDPSAFAQPSDLGRIGSAPRAVCCGPGINNLDLALLKTFTVNERSSVQFRAEFFNAANHAQFTKVDGNISDGQVSDGGTFGKVLRARDPRLLQFALKFAF